MLPWFNGFKDGSLRHSLKLSNLFNKHYCMILFVSAIYDDTITDAFVRTIQLLLSVPPKRSVYVALEKRYVFTISDCASTAPCYEYFLQCLQQIKKIKTEDVPLNFPTYFEYDRVKELVLLKITAVL